MIAVKKNKKLKWGHIVWCVQAPGIGPGVCVCVPINISWTVKREQITTAHLLFSLGVSTWSRMLKRFVVQ